MLGLDIESVTEKIRIGELEESVSGSPIIAGRSLELSESNEMGTASHPRDLLAKLWVAILFVVESRVVHPGIFTCR